MAVYYSIKCPNCKKEVESGKNRTTQYGTPFRVCRYCGHGYVDNNYIEPGVMDEEELVKHKFAWPALIYVAIGALFLYGAWNGSIFLGILGFGAIAFSIFAMINSIKYKPEEDEKLIRELQASKERLSDPHYVIALWKAGCYINVELLDWAKKTVAEEGE